MAALARIAREQRLAFVAAPLVPPDHAWVVHHLFSADSYANATSTLCVSATELWVECKRRPYWNDGEYTGTLWTERLALHAVLPVELLHSRDIKLPAVVPHAMAQTYRKRLQLLKTAEEIHDLLASSACEMESAVPDERLALADRIWFGESGPFLAARRARQKIDEELERWEAALDAKRLELCREILRIDIGDIVVLATSRGHIRIRVENASVYTGDNDVSFTLSGTRFRKDGTVGKRQESFYLRLEDEQPRA